MTINLKLFAIATITASTFANAATNTVDARGAGMGGVGVVSGSYLTAPFYNPALTAIYRRNDDAGMIIPALGLNYNDEYQMLDKIDNVVNLMNNGGSPEDVDSALNGLEGTDAKIDIGAAVAFGIPNRLLAATIYGQAYTENFAAPDIDTTGSNTAERVTRSGVKTMSVGIAEVGVSLAKYQTLFGQHFSFGISPKIQRVYTFTSVNTLNEFQLENIKESSLGETAFNLDAGALWFHGPMRVGFSAKNLMAREIQTASGTINVGGRDIHYGDIYKMNPVYTVGAGFVADYFQFSVDYDLNKAEKFSSFDDDTQALRAGLEVDLVRQIQLRAGYIRNMARDTEDTVTAGIGLSPLNLFDIHVAASYTSKNAMGAYLNLAASY
ncbi:conjugal transfer protein TraF [Vibrio sp. ZSDZ34]|uniref:Conjugal transfer protein TraF n=1 Tax=Vibrio gelatinilyticus TaxID=2893468 RepID=A0A9X2AWD6_9VIBR|nr:conjugal transfer protein TraF [Vibrio gelatinilyticus]MCJ2377156.1 conjugal transfer protein TraF [Vibrio gelatinilyticus]